MTKIRATLPRLAKSTCCTILNCFCRESLCTALRMAGMDVQKACDWMASFHPRLPHLRNHTR